MLRNYTTTILTLLLVLGLGLNSQAQTDGQGLIFRVNSPAGAAGDYDWGGTSDWGAAVTESITADVAWAYDDVDSLMCSSPAINDLTGKVALIRRGACNFSLKAYNAQAGGAIGFIICNNNAANPSELVTMAGGDSATAVVIPGIFISFETCGLLADAIANGQTPSVSFLLPNIYNPFGPYSYHTPQSQIIPLDEIQVNVVNYDSMNVLADVEVTVNIDEPGGGTTTLSQTLDIPPSTDTIIQFDDYVPSDLGEYTMTYSAPGLTSDEVSHTFVITESIFALDNNDFSSPFGLSPSEQGFLDAGLQYHMGSFYLAGPDGGTATFAAFAIHNPADFATGDPADDEFIINLYDCDPDGDGEVSGTLENYDDFQIVGFSSYQLATDYVADELIIVEFDEPVALNPNGQYMVSVQYDGGENGSGIPPQFTGTSTTNYPYLASTVFAQGANAGDPPRLYMGGWAGGQNAVIRMLMDNFVNTESVSKLAEAKLSVFPTLATDNLNVELALENTSQVEMRIFDINSRLLGSYEFEGVQQETLNLDISNLSNGMYFLAVETEEGYRALKFVVEK